MKRSASVEVNEGVNGLERVSRSADDRIMSFGASLSLRDVSRSFPETGRVLDGLDLEIAAGDFVALLGPSGCGKSSLLRIAAGLDQPDEGVAKATGGGARGFVFQDPCLLPWRTALENCALPLQLAGSSRGESAAAARAALTRVGLGDAVDRYPAQLSGGMRMRASVARALARSPSLLLLDEPFAALDEPSRHALQADLRELWERERMTILFVTHSVAEAAFLAERTVGFSARPARVIFDHRSRLKGPRVRWSPEAAEETKFIYAGLGR